MVNVGISRGAAALSALLPGDYSLPTSGDVVLAAKAAEMPLIDFAFKTTAAHFYCGHYQHGDRSLFLAAIPG